MQRRLLPAVLLLTALLIVGTARWAWLRERQRFAAMQPVSYQGTAIVGNGRLLAALDGRGTIISLCWPHPGGAPLLCNPRRVEYAPRRTPPVTGCYLGIQDGGGRITWLRDCRVISQQYVADSTRLMTRYALPWGRTVTVTDWARPDTDVLIRRVTSEPSFGKNARLVAYQNLDLGGAREENHATMTGGLLAHWRAKPAQAVVVGGDIPPDSAHIGDVASYGALCRGWFPDSDETPADLITAGRWPIARERTVVYAMAPSVLRAAQLVRETIAVDADMLAREADNTCRQWLTAGRMPDMPAEYRGLYTRSLLTLKLLQDRDTGALAAGARDYWDYCWPRDGVYGAVAFDLAGHHAEAAALYRFLARMQDTDGGWDARCRLDGSPARDDRPEQLDAAGYFAWGVGAHGMQGGDADQWYPPVAAAARYIMAHTDPRTDLPGPGADYWESSTDLREYLANAIVCQAGLRAAAQQAQRLGQYADARRFDAAASRMKAGIARHLWNPAQGVYARAFPDFTGVDSAAALAVAPFGLFPPDNARLAATMKRVEARLATNAGGIVPGEGWPTADPWVPETALLVPYYCARRETTMADRHLAWVLHAATSAGALPETVSVETGKPNSTTPLAWSHAAFVLAAEARWGRQWRDQ